MACTYYSPMSLASFTGIGGILLIRLLVNARDCENTTGKVRAWPGEAFLRAEVFKRKDELAIEAERWDAVEAGEKAERPVADNAMIERMVGRCVCSASALYSG